ncbi:protein SICKLE-like isoform X2 [Vigna radiata var. radiata]|uniref:Protein SICKLE-like isoform X2 n=1 Tax=Vigna radiata var. radiata TaxID=3916 RepID=A0A3Q0EPD7_VIGRR|nr:protein SICKLE-like isoform X2 [Vigna radiata var. radiata]
MEDSEQRKKRLRKMRMQADHAEVSGAVEGSAMPGSLSNPLIEAPLTMPSWDKSYAAPRFDFYTDPMSAFSSNKRNNTSIQAAPDSFPPNVGRSPMAQYSSPHPESTNPRMTLPPFQVSAPTYGNMDFSGTRGPAHDNFLFHPSSVGRHPNPRFEPSGGPLYNSTQGIAHRASYSPNPSPGYNNRTRPSYSPNPSPGYSNCHRPSYSPNPSPGYNSPRPSYSPSPSPGYSNSHRPSYSPNPSPGYNNSPRPSYSLNPSPGYSNNHRPSYSPNPSPGYSNSPRHSYSPNLSPGYSNSPMSSYSPNPSPRHRSSPRPGQGRGRGVWHNPGNSVSGRGSGRGPNFHGHLSNENAGPGPNRFYQSSMVEDPWNHLEPKIWEAIDGSLHSSRILEKVKPWISKSKSTIGEGSSAASVKFRSEQSLAEYLATAFNEAANDAENV